MTGRLIDGECGGKPRPTRMKTDQGGGKRSGQWQDRNRLRPCSRPSVPVRYTKVLSWNGVPRAHCPRWQSPSRLRIRHRLIRCNAKSKERCSPFPKFTSSKWVYIEGMSFHVVQAQDLRQNPVSYAGCTSTKRSRSVTYCACAYGPRKHTFKFLITC